MDQSVTPAASMCCGKNRQKMDGTSSKAASAAAMRKGPWTEEEDAQLVWFVRLFGERRWDFLAKVSGLKRTGKSCRLRWVNYLHPGLRRGRITADEERLILQLHAQYGSRWSRIARSLPGRTDNEIKNFWRTRMRKHRAQQQQNKTASSASSTITTTSCSGGSPSSGSGTATATSSSALQESVGDDEAELDEASTAATAASHKHHHHLQPPQQQERDAMDQLWSDIAAAEAAASYMMVDTWGGAGHPAAAEPLPMPSSPVWEYCSSDYSLWRIDDEEYYKKTMLHA